MQAWGHVPVRHGLDQKYTVMDRHAVNQTDLVTGGLTLLFGFAALSLVPAEVDSAGFAAIRDMRSPAFFPLVAGGLLTVFSALLILRALIGGGMQSPLATGDAKPADQDAPQDPAAEPWRVALAAGLLVLAAAGIFWLGFLLTAGGLVAGLAAILGYRRYWLIVLLAVSVPAGIHVLFEQLLSVLLPRGVF